MAGQEIPGADQEKYLYNGSVKMYSVGRLVDPGSGTMREAGTVPAAIIPTVMGLMPTKAPSTRGLSLCFLRMLDARVTSRRYAGGLAR